MEESDADHTHPSEHNSVVLTERKESQSARTTRLRVKAAERLIKAGNLDDWGKITKARRERGGHNHAFLAETPELFADLCGILVSSS